MSDYHKFSRYHDLVTTWLMAVKKTGNKFSRVKPIHENNETITKQKFGSNFCI